MIFYFTGTGNSLYAAKALADATNDSIISIADALKKEQYTFELSDNESIGFVFPIYYWGLPTVVTKFIKNLKLDNYKGNFIYSIITCGANIGDAMNVLKKALAAKNYHLDSGFTVAMPDNYILMYDIIPKEMQDQKLSTANQQLIDICQKVNEKQKGVFLLQRGPVPSLFTYGVNALYKYGRKTKKFYALDSCTGCGLCQKICPCDTIHISGRKPVWGKECTQCLACINRCPVKAIQYGKSTLKRGRYVNPKVKF